MQQVSNATTHTSKYLNGLWNLMRMQRSWCCYDSVCVMLASISHYHSNNGCETPTHQISDQHKTKKPLKNWVAYGSGSWRIRTADPLLVRQMLWTSWAKLPICKAWDCKGSYYFLFSKLFLSFFSKGLVIFSEARPHLTYLWLSQKFELCHLRVHPSHLSAWTRTWT